jgi:glycolate oxidase FAD binding subunit
MARSTEGSVERLTLDGRRVDGAGASTSSSPALVATARVDVVRPGDTASVRDVVRDAIARTAPLRIVGRGTWLDAGRPVADGQRVALDGLTGIVDYTPGDLTLTARAGTTLAEIAEATAANGQWLALAPWGGDVGSLGAAAATASAGPMSGALGTPRDNVIGLEVVTGTGDVVRGGGRVVKNVAGFDLTRLMVGAWGTLGVITEVSVRLRALPEVDATLALAAPNAATQLGALLTLLRTAPVAPLGLELLSASLAQRLGIGTETLLLARLAGNGESVTAQRDALGQVGDVVEIDGGIWNRLRAVEPASASVVRLSGTVGRFAETWNSAQRVAATVDGAFAHATVLRSVVRVVVPDEDGTLPAAAADALGAQSRDVRIFERLPAALWSSLAPTPVADRLSRGIRTAFDPHRLLNPGILGES